MAGRKGRSGGPRKNSGGARPGAGRKRKIPLPAAASQPQSSVEVHLEQQGHGGALKRSQSVPVPMEQKDMLQLLQDVALGRTEASALQVRAAIAAVQYTHPKFGDGGKKEAAEEAAKKASAGRFSRGIAPPIAGSRPH